MMNFRNVLMNGFRKVLSIAVVISMLASIPVFADSSGEIAVYVNGVQVAFDVPPLTQSGRTLVPMRAIFEALGAEINWDAETRTATAVKGEITVKVTVDSDTMMKNGEPLKLEVPAMIIGGRTLVPVRAVSEGMEAKVFWNAADRQIYITTGEEGALPSDSDGFSYSDAYQYYELSEDDMALLKDSYDIIRYYFEQKSLSESFLVPNDDLKAEIKKKSDVVKDFINFMWSTVVTANIMIIQEESEESYIFPADGDQDFLENYQKLIDEAGLSAENYFDITFETLTDGSTMVLLTFKETDTPMSCKYIGIVLAKDNTIKYFTAESDPNEKEQYFFCYITLHGRGSFGLIDPAKSDFIGAVNTVMAR